MKITKKFIINMSIVFITILIGSKILEEKYCYNYSFTELDRRGIKLGEVEQELKIRGYSPLQALQTFGSKEWWDIYTQCNGEFSLLNIDFSILQKSYPYHEHFIDW